MKTLSRILSVFVACALLGACSYFKTDEGPNVSGNPYQQGGIYVTDLNQAAAMGAVGTMETPAQAVSRHTDGRVEIFPLNDAGSYTLPGPAADMRQDSVQPIDVAPVNAVPVDGGSVSLMPAGPAGGVAVPGNPSVEIFPIDGALFEPFRPSSDLPPIPESVLMEPAGVSGAVMRHGILAAVYFDHDSTAIRPEGLDLLRGLAPNLPQAALNGVAVEGHASNESSIKDAVRRQTVNLRVSMERAVNVASALMGFGIPAERIETRAFGDTRPAGTPAESRRVELLPL